MRSAVLWVILPTTLLGQVNVTGARSAGAYLYRENKGQVRDQYWRARPDVLFHGRAEGLVFHLLATGMLYQIDRPFPVPVKDREELMKLPPDERFRGGEIYRIDVAWVGANPAPRIEKGEASPDYENYYNVAYGVEPALFVRRYRDVWYRGVWDGIDIHFHVGGEGEMEYTWVVAPGGDVGRIRVQVGGAEVRVEGSYLVYWTPFGEVREGPLRAWQGDGKPVQVCWRVEGDMVTLSAEAYDRTQTLYIDPPTRVWGTYYGGSNQAEVVGGLGLAVGDAQSVYLASDTNSSDQIASVGAHQTTYGGGTQDLFLAKFSSVGTRLWATYYGGADWDHGGTVAVNPSNTNEVYLAGGTGTSGTPLGVIATAGAHQTTFGGSWDACLVKFNAAGVRQWGTYYGGSGIEAWYTSAVAVSPADGSVYLTTGTSSDNGISTINTRAGGYDAFIVKFNPSGARQWGRYFGGTGEDGTLSVGVATDKLGNPYITSYTTSTDLPVVNPHQSTYGGGDHDAFIARFNPSTAAIEWATYYGGDGDDGYGLHYAHSIRVTGSFVLVAGLTNSTNDIASPGAYQTSLGGWYDAFLVCFNTSGTRLWGTYYGGPSLDVGYSVEGDGGGGFYLAGYTRSTTSIATANAYQPNLAGGWDAFVVKFNGNNGMRIWGTYYGGGNSDYAWAVVSTGTGSFYLAGETGSSTGIATPGSHKPTLENGGWDAFLVKFDDPITPQAYQHEDPPQAATSTSSGSGIRLLSHPSVEPVVLIPEEEIGEGYQWMLHDMSGRVLGEGYSGVRELAVPLGGYPAGRYLLTIIGRRIWQVVVERPQE